MRIIVLVRVGNRPAATERRSEGRSSRPPQARGIAQPASARHAEAGSDSAVRIWRSDRTGAFPASDPFTPYDVGATVYQALGVDPEAETRDALNRPLRR